MRKTTFLLAAPLAALALTAVTAALAQQPPAVDPARVDALVKEAFPAFPAAAGEWQSRLAPDETMKQCAAHNNLPPKAVGDAIQTRERAAIQYPADGKFIGDWKKGEQVAQSGYGLRFTDYPSQRANGGNCYACHQITRAEVSYGTIGPSLLNYGKIRKFGEAETKAAYEKIYNPHATFPCSLMPRLGANKVLTIEQIKDAVALLMDPESPANK